MSDDAAVCARNSRGTALAALLAALVCGAAPARAGAFVEPQVFSSKDGSLDVVLIARPQTVETISFTPPGGPALHPVAWVYEVCARPTQGDADQCPPGSPAAADLGGVRLALQKGDALKIRLVNRLPKLDPAKLGRLAEPSRENLSLNPTNLDFQGLDSPPRPPTLADPTFGNDVWMQVYNAANSTPAPEPPMGMHEMTRHDSIVKDAADYRIDIPADHFSGVAWFHPFVKGLTINQLSSGLSGLISVGVAGDYARGDTGEAPFAEDKVRHLMLKDMQVLAAGKFHFEDRLVSVADGEVLNEADPAFCPAARAAGDARQGSCAGGNDYSGGRWYFTVSGALYPTLRISAPDGELWRLVNASGGMSYNLRLVDGATKAPMAMQLISVDGGRVITPPETAPGVAVDMGGARFKMVACPPAAGIAAPPGSVCVSELAIAPRSRAEVWVTYRDEEGRVAEPPKGAAAILRTGGQGSEAAGDFVPDLDLARVEFAQTGAPSLTAPGLAVRVDQLAPDRPFGNVGAAFP